MFKKKNEPKILTQGIKSLRENEDKIKDMFQMFIEGMTYKDISITTNKTEHFVKESIAQTLDSLVAYWSQPTSYHTYVRYASQQFRLIKELQGIVKELNEGEMTVDSSGVPIKVKKNHSASISAIKAQSDLYDKVLDRGISMGVIQGQKEESVQDAFAMSSAQTMNRLKELLVDTSTLIDAVGADNEMVPTLKQIEENPARPHELEMNKYGSIEYMYTSSKSKQSAQQRKNSLLLLKAENKKLLEMADAHDFLKSESKKMKEASKKQ